MSLELEGAFDDWDVSSIFAEGYDYSQKSETVWLGRKVSCGSLGEEEQSIDSLFKAKLAERFSGEEPWQKESGLYGHWIEYPIVFGEDPFDDIDEDPLTLAVWQYDSNPPFKLAPPHWQFQVENCGLKKFWKKHKKAIIITTVALVVIGAVVVVVVTSGAAGGAAVAAGGAALNSLLDDESQDQNFPPPSYSQPPSAAPQKCEPSIPMDVPTPAPIQAAPPNSYSLPPSSWPEPSGLFLPTDVPAGVSAFPRPSNTFPQFPHSTLPEKSKPPSFDFSSAPSTPAVDTPKFWEIKPDSTFPPYASSSSTPRSAPLFETGPLERVIPIPEDKKPLQESNFSGSSLFGLFGFFLEKYGNTSPTQDPSAPLEPSSSSFSGSSLLGLSGLLLEKYGDSPLSETLPTLGSPNPELLAMGINGLNTSREEALGHQAYLGSLVNNKIPMDFIYNHSNGVAVDLLEVFCLNYLGISPLLENQAHQLWQEFADYHKDNPNKKILQYCHSQGAIHIYNALESAPQELRDRVIVVAIGPAKVVPRALCHESFNYACKDDIVPLGEGFFASLLEIPDVNFDPSALWQMTLENREELILLDPAPGETGMGHNFQNEIFKDPITKHLTDYINRNGEYP